MNSLTRIISYDKTKIKNQESCNCVECVSVENAELKNQTVEYPKLSEEEIEKIIFERYSDKDEKTKNFIRKALRKHGDRYDYSDVVYVKYKENVEIICRVKGHNSFPQTPDHHLHGQGCRLCGIEKRANKQRMTLEKFIKKARKIHGNKYDYSKVKYVNYDTEVIITCPIHGDFPQTPHHHLCGSGCLICGYINVSEELKMTKEECIKRAIEMHGNKYDYSKVVYVNNHTEVIIVCLKHGGFKQIPNSHLNGEGCQLCRSSKGETMIRNWLIKNKIEFEEQKRFDDCKDKRKLPFDFYIPKYNLCLEFDGMQHFIPHDFNSKMTEEQKLENLKRLQFRDKIKTNYCKNNNINLLRIRYDENVKEKLTLYFKNHKVIKEQMIFDLTS